MSGGLQAFRAFAEDAGADADVVFEALWDYRDESPYMIRGGELVPDLPAEELVPGDIVEIGVGVLVDAPESAELLVEFAEGCYDALALDKY